MTSANIALVSCSDTLDSGCLDPSVALDIRQRNRARASYGDQRDGSCHESHIHVEVLASTIAR